MTRGTYDRTHLRGPRPDTARRIAQIQEMRAAGRSFASIGAELGISKQRVHQIISRRENGEAYMAPYARARYRRTNAA